jgi:hypothetical protein
MKLDRNTNTDGRGKYALIKRRVLDLAENDDLQKNQPPYIAIKRWAIDAGNKFFVLKYQDAFTAPALRAYALAVRERAHVLNSASRGRSGTIGDVLRKEATELFEYANEIDEEVKIAETHQTKIPD